MLRMLGQDMLLGSEWVTQDFRHVLGEEILSEQFFSQSFLYVHAKSILQQAFHLSLCQGRAYSLKLNSLFRKWKLKKKKTPKGVLWS